MKHLITLLIATLLPLAVLAQAPDCKSRESLVVAQAQIDEALKALEDYRPDKELEAMVAALGWSKERQSDLLRKVLSSPNYMAFHKEQLPYVRALGEAVISSSGPAPSTSKCEAAKQVKSLATKIMEVNIRKHAYATREIRRIGSDAK